MRMGTCPHSIIDHSIPAHVLINSFSEQQLANIIFTYGQERQSRKIARAIATERAKRPIMTTHHLAEIVATSIGRSRASFNSAKHPAAKTFQALRIYINDELTELKQGLIASERLLNPSGHAAFVTFHSLEDKLVKRFFKACSKGALFDFNHGLDHSVHWKSILI